MPPPFTDSSSMNFSDPDRILSAESVYSARHLLANSPVASPLMTQHNIEETSPYTLLFDAEFPFEYTYEVAPFTIDYDVKNVNGISETAILGLSQQDKTFYPEFIEFSPVKIGSFNQTGTFYDIVVDGDITYLADRLSGVYVLNTSISNSPENLFKIFLGLR